MDSDNDIKTISEVGIHVRYLRKEVDALSRRIADVATKNDLKELEIELRKEIEDNKPSTLFWMLTKFAAGVISLGGMFGVFYAIVEALKK